MKKTIMAFCGLALAVSAGVVNANEIKFTGSVVDAACAIGGDTAKEVELGQVRVASFSAAGDTSSKVPFKIVLEDCDAALGKGASVTFTGDAAGTADMTDSTGNVTPGDGYNSFMVGKVVGVAGASNGIGLQIIDNQSNIIAPGGVSGEYALIDGQTTLNFSARYVALLAQDKIKPGAANAVVDFTVAYN